jgi:superfamily II DNA or RNA helicase
MEKLALVDPLMNVGVVKAARNELDRDVVIASIQTLARRRRLEQLGTDFSTVVVDEAHHAPAPTYELVLEYLSASAFEDYGPLLVGFTVTPERGDRQPLGHIFDELVYQKTILEMIPDYLSDLRAIQIRLARADFNSLHIHHGEYRDDEVEEMLFNANAPEHVAESYMEYAQGRKTLIFSPSVDLAHAMVDAFHDVGEDRIEAIDGRMPLDQRRAILRRFHTGETQIVSNCFVLTEGFDQPDVGCVVICPAHP